MTIVPMTEAAPMRAADRVLAILAIGDVIFPLVGASMPAMAVRDKVLCREKTT